MAANVAASDPSDDLVTQFCAVTGADRETGRQLLAICHSNLEMAIGMHMDQEEGAGAGCSTSGADRETGRQLLAICHSNLEMAIGMHMDQEEGAGADTARPSGSGAWTGRPPAPHQDGMDSGAAATASGEEDELNGIRAPIPQRHEVLVEEAPKHGAYRGGMRRMRRSVFDGFRDFQAEARQQEGLMVAGRSIGKQHTLEDLFRPPIDMTYKGTFHTAREAGTLQNKWLLVNIQNVQEFACQVLNRDVWSNITVKTLVKKNFIFWQVYNDSDEGKKFMQFYKVHTWPHVAVIDPVTGENLVTWDKVESSSFPDLIREFVTDRPAPQDNEELPAKRQKRASSIVDASEDAQIEAAIKASLHAGSKKSAASSSATATLSATQVLSAIIDIDSDQSNLDSSDELETFTGSEESNDKPAEKSKPVHNREQGHSFQRRNFSAISNRSATASSSSSNHRCSDAASSSSGAAAGGSGFSFSSSSSRHSHSHGVDDTTSTLPSTSGSSSSGVRDMARLGAVAAEDSETDSLGFREAYGNTPNSVDILGSRSSEFHTLDDSSSTNSSFVVGGGGGSGSGGGASTTVVVDSDGDTRGSGGGGRLLGRGGVEEEGEKEEAAAAVVADAGPPVWEKHFGDASDASTNLLFRFPDGKKEQLSLPCSSKLEALFVFCSSKGFDTDSYELVVNFPRRSVSSLGSGSTVMDAKLHPQETIFVQAR